MSAWKSANFFSSPQIANCKFLQNTAQLCLKIVLKVVFLHDFFYFTFYLELYMLYLEGERLFISGLAEALSPQITKNWVREKQIRKGSHLLKVRKSNKYLSPQICGFAICGTYLRTAQLWYKEMLIFVWGNGLTSPNPFKSLGFFLTVCY